MSKGKDPKKGKVKKTKMQRLMSTFLKSAGITLLVSIFLVGLLAWSYRYFMYDDSGLEENPEGIIQNPLPEEKDIRQTVAVFGIDKDGYRTDVILLVNFDSKTKKINVLSIPRDTKIDWREDMKQKLRDIKGHSVSVSKINEMTAYAGIENIREFTISEIENMLSIKVDNYAIVSIDAFNKIVDAIGGVEVDVPALDNGRGLHYDDYSQDLHIHLEPGLQLLDGKQAEGLVRFRHGYVEGDVGRIKTQQLFLESFAKKVMSPQIITKVPQIASVLFSSIKTDIPLSDIPKYYSYMKKLDVDNINFEIIPGEGRYIGSVSYFIPDMSQMEEVVNKVFFETPQVEETTAVSQEETQPRETEPKIDRTVTIQILNASGIRGQAQKAKELIEADNYIVNNIGNFQGDRQTGVTIYATDATRAQQFKKYYPNANIEQKQDIDYDIVIILGADE